MSDYTSSRCKIGGVPSRGRTLAMLIIVVIAILAIAFAPPYAESAEVVTPTTGRQKDLERLIRRSQNVIRYLEQAKVSEELNLDWLMATACNNGLLQYCIEEVAVPEAAPGAPPDAIWEEWDISRYYTPLSSQRKFLYEWVDPHRGETFVINLEKESFSSRQNRLCVPGNTRWLGYKSRAKGTYGADFCVNAHGDPFKTANGTDLRLETPYRVAACDPAVRFGARIDIEGIGTVKCVDRGGKVGAKRIDIWVGIGDEGIDNLVSGPNGGKRKARVY